METNTRTRHGLSARFSLVGGLRGFLAALGFAGALATLAVAQQPGSRAGLLPPRPLDAGDIAPIARGAIPDTPTSDTTPVPRSNSKSSLPATSGPAWLSGIDPNVLPATGTSSSPASTKSGVVTAGPFGGLGSSAPRPAQPTMRDEPGSGKGIERFKSGMTGNDRGANDSKSQADSPNANTPFRGTTANGAPVFAGPPAYRWYGYGSVTPGANPYAPSGVYPKASANWYSVTGATPGAFPVAVTNPQRQPGIDPPSYMSMPANRNPSVIPTTATQPAFGPPPVPTGSMPAITSSNSPPMSDVKVIPLPSPVGLEPSRPMSPISAPVKSDLPLPPTGPTMPIGVPIISAPPGGASMPLPPLPDEMKPVAPANIAPPVSVVPPRGPQEPALLPPSSTPMPLTATKPAGDEPSWQPGEQPRLPEGTWSPAVGQPKPLNQPESARPTDQLRIRAQMPDARKGDPTIDFIRAICQGRASGVEIRWTGSRRLSVCFESRNEPDAATLVRDISARRELAPLQIDFCVFVK